MRPQELGARAAVEQLDGAIDRFGAVLGLDRSRIGLVGENELARVIARPDRRGYGFDQRAHRGGILELLLMAARRVPQARA